MMPPRLGITLGDPAGIGPEIVVKAFSQPGLLPAAEYILFGSRQLLEEEQRRLGLELRLGNLVFAKNEGGSLTLHDLGEPSGSWRRGESSAAAGRVSFQYFEKAVDEARKGRLEAVVTAPISKQSWNRAGISWRGHTEYLDSLFPGSIMAFWSDRMRIALFSHHLPLKDALGLVKADVLQRFFVHLHECLEKAGQKGLELVVAGLNPHAGEDGMLGKEEKREIRPAVERAKAAGLKISGPWPPDIVFRQALDRPDLLAVALYHDQGLIAFKLVAFETGVNVSLGLPFVRTSPDHGTAFDIAGLGKADPESLRQAILLGRRLAAAPLQLRS
jgi:4-hydroxythreonine-4-phosphate dehydrogenase